MVTKIIPIQTAKGINIPFSMLKECHIETTAELIIKNEEIIIRPAKRNPRENWDKAFKLMHQLEEDKLLIEDNLDMEEWYEKCYV
jgi:antitoxin MazE